MPPITYYVVFVGRRPGIYDSWPECQLQVNGFPGNSFKSYKSKTAAEKAYEAHRIASKQEANYGITCTAGHGLGEIPTFFNTRENNSLLKNRRCLEVGVAIGLIVVVTAAVLKLIA